MGVFYSVQEKGKVLLFLSRRFVLKQKNYLLPSVPVPNFSTIRKRMDSVTRVLKRRLLNEIKDIKFVQSL